MSIQNKTMHTHTAAETRALAARIGAAMPAGAVIAAAGDLGVGKTVFAAGLAQGLGVAGPVVSPTYIFFQEYAGRLPFCHIDAYRLEGLSEEEISLTGVADCFRRGKAAFVEWPDFINDFLPAGTIRLRMARGQADGDRLLTFCYDDEKQGWLHAIIGD